MRFPLAAFFSLLLAATGAGAGQRYLHLAVGDADRRDREVPIVVDGIVDTGTGETLTAEELAPELAGVRLLLVGESHTSIQFHRVQLRVIRALHEAGREVLIGLEMYPYTKQAQLDSWSRGYVTEEGFLKLSSWYDSWGYHWNYYRDIFFYARDNGIDLYAVNTPREVVTAVRTKGFEDLTEEEEAHIPSQIDTDNDEHRQLFRAFFDEDDPLHTEMSEEMWRGMFNAQCTWDATMGYNAVKALEAHGGDDAIMVVLVGSGHVSYGLGIERQAEQWFDGRIATLIPIPIRDDEDEPVETVRASYADFLWGLPSERAPIYPGLGLSTRSVEDGQPRVVIYISEESLAEEAGFELDDVLLEMDGVALNDKETFNRLMAAKRWGDSSVYKVRRGEVTLEIPVAFRRSAPDPDDAGEESP